MSIIIPQGRQNQMAITDEQVKQRKKYFFFKNGQTNFSPNVIDQLQIDEAGYYMISDAVDATETAHRIRKLESIKDSQITITDGCAGDAGNTLQFIFNPSFALVNAVEKDKMRFQSVLSNNITVATRQTPDHNKATARPILGDYFAITENYNQDVVFFDPPWGGTYYSNHDKLALFLGDKHMAEIVVDLYRNSRRNGTKYVAIKACNNFDVKDMSRVLGNHSKAFHDIDSEQRVQILHTVLKRGREVHDRKQKYVVYFIKIPDLQPEDIEQRLHNPGCIPVASKHTRIHLHLKNTLAENDYYGLFYLEQSAEDDMLNFLKSEWGKRASDHAPIVLNIAYAMTKDLEKCDFSARLHMDRRLGMKHFTSLPHHSEEKLDTYDQNDGQQITENTQALYYNKDISAWDENKQKVDSLVDGLRKGQKMLLVYLVGIDHYAMILCADENGLELHHIKDRDREDLEVGFKGEDYRNSVEENTKFFFDNLASGNTVNPASLQATSDRIYQSGVLYAMFKALEAVLNSVQMSDEEKSETKEKIKYLTESILPTYMRSSEGIDDTNGGNSQQQILQSLRDGLEQEENNKLRREQLIKEKKNVDNNSNLSAQDTDKTGAKTHTQEHMQRNSAKDEQERRNPLSNNSNPKIAKTGTGKETRANKKGGPTGTRQDKNPKTTNTHKIRKQENKKQAKKWQKLRARPVNEIPFEQYSQCLHYFGKNMILFLQMDIREQIKIFKSSLTLKYYMPVTDDDLKAFGVRFRVDTETNKPLFDQVISQNSLVYTDRPIDNFQISSTDRTSLKSNLESGNIHFHLYRLGTIFSKHWNIIRCFAMRLSKRLAYAVAINYHICGTYQPFPELTTWISKTRSPLFPERDFDAGAQTAISQDFASQMSDNITKIPCSKFLQLDVPSQVRLVLKHVDDAVKFEVDADSFNVDTIMKFQIDPWTKLFLQEHTEPKFIKEVCESMYRLLFVVLVRVDPEWGLQKTLHRRYANLFETPSQQSKDNIENEYETKTYMRDNIFESLKTFLQQGPGGEESFPTLFNRTYEHIHQNVTAIVQKRIYKYATYFRNIAKILGIRLPHQLGTKLTDDTNANIIIKNIVSWMSYSILQSCQPGRFWIKFSYIHGMQSPEIEKRVIEYNFQGNVKNMLELDETMLRNQLRRSLKNENTGIGFFRKEYHNLYFQRWQRPFGLCWLRIPIVQENIDAEQVLNLVKKIQTIDESEKNDTLSREDKKQRYYCRLELGMYLVKMSQNQELDSIEGMQFDQDTGTLMVNFEEEEAQIQVNPGVMSAAKRMLAIYERSFEFQNYHISDPDVCLDVAKVESIFQTREELSTYQWHTYFKNIIHQRSNLRVSEQVKMCLIDRDKKFIYVPRNFNLDRQIIPLGPGTILRICNNGDESDAQYYGTYGYHSYFGNKFAQTFLKQNTSKFVTMQKEEELANLLSYLCKELFSIYLYRDQYLFFGQMWRDLNELLAKGFTSKQDIPLVRIFPNTRPFEEWTRQNIEILQTSIQQNNANIQFYKNLSGDNNSTYRRDSLRKAYYNDLRLHWQLFNQEATQKLSSRKPEDQNINRSRYWELHESLNRMFDTTLSELVRHFHETSQDETITDYNTKCIAYYEKYRQNVESINHDSEPILAHRDRGGNVEAMASEQENKAHATEDKKVIQQAQTQTTKDRILEIQKKYEKLPNTFIKTKINTNKKSNEGKTALDIMDGTKFEAEYNELSKGDQKDMENKLLEFLFKLEGQFLKQKYRKNFEKKETTQNAATDDQEADMAKQPSAYNIQDATQPELGAQPADNMPQKQNSDSNVLDTETINNQITKARALKQEADYMMNAIKYWKEEDTSRFEHIKQKLQQDIEDLRSYNSSMQNLEPEAEYQEMYMEAKRTTSEALESLRLRLTESENKIEELKQKSKQKQVKEKADGDEQAAGKSLGSDKTNNDKASPKQTVVATGTDDMKTENLKKKENQYATIDNDTAKENLKSKGFSKNFIDHKLVHSHLGNLWEHITELEKKGEKFTQDNLVDELKQHADTLIYLKEKHIKSENKLYREPLSGEKDARITTPSNWGQADAQKIIAAKTNPYSRYQFLDNYLENMTRFQPLESVKVEYNKRYQQRKSWFLGYRRILEDSKYDDFVIFDTNPDNKCLFYALSFIANVENKDFSEEKRGPWTGLQMRNFIIDRGYKKLQKSSIENGVQIHVSQFTYQEVEKHINELVEDEEQWGDLAYVAPLFMEYLNIRLDFLSFDAQNPQQPHLKTNTDTPTYTLVLGSEHFGVMVSKKQLEGIKEKTLQSNNYLHKKHIKQYLPRIWYYDDVSENKTLPEDDKTTQMS